MNTLRESCIANLRNEIQDVLVVGAGINGAVTAAALAGRGAKVAVIDKADFASFTSQASSNLAWGGIKYLETYEFGLVWNLCGSRNRLMKAYPSQVREIRFFTSIAKGFRKSRFVIYLGALLYWIMGRCHTKPPRLLSNSTIQRHAPMVHSVNLAGGLEYSDCYFVDNDARFTFGFIRSILRQAGSAVNYMELVGADWHEGLWRCKVIDHVSGETFSVDARTLVNATGPFTDRINRMLHIDSTYRHVLSKGVHIIVPRITKTEHVLTFFASDGRLFFMIPMGNRTCIGTTDTRVEQENVAVEDKDIDFLLANANALLALERPLTRDEVIATRCGVRPLAVRKESDVGDSEWMALSRKHEIDIHPDQGMCSIYGGKLADCLNVGEEVAGIIESFGIALDCPSEGWFGEPSADKKGLFADACRAVDLKSDQISRLWRRYGNDGFDILQRMQNNHTMAERVVDNILRAELHHMADFEMVVHLEDFLRRRTMLELTLGREALLNEPSLKECARTLFGETAKSELKRYFNR